LTVGGRIAARRALIAVSLAGCLLVIGGCSEQGSDEQGSSEPIQSASAPVDPRPPAAQAKDTVRSYYDWVNVGSYRRAFALFSPELQATNGGFAAWRAGYAQTAYTELRSLRTVSTTPAEVVVGIKLNAEAEDVCGDSVPQAFEGTWTLENVGGAFVGTALNVAQTGGGDLANAPAACAPPPAPPQTPPPPGSPTTSSCDPSYSGACLDPNSSDYDCEGGSGNGPDYTGPVQVVGDDHYGLDANGDGLGCEDS
jgi:hypothetical protein